MITKNQQPSTFQGEGLPPHARVAASAALQRKRRVPGRGGYPPELTAGAVPW